MCLAPCYMPCVHLQYDVLMLRYSIMQRRYARLCRSCWSTARDSRVVSSELVYMSWQNTMKIIINRTAKAGAVETVTN